CILQGSGSSFCLWQACDAAHGACAYRRPSYNRALSLREGTNPRPVRPTSLQTRSMWFKNLRIFRLAPSWDLAPDALENALAKLELRPGCASDMTTFGWTSPRPEAGLVNAMDGLRLLNLRVE